MSSERGCEMHLPHVAPGKSFRLSIESFIACLLLCALRSRAPAGRSKSHVNQTKGNAVVAIELPTSPTKGHSTVGSTGVINNASACATIEQHLVPPCDQSTNSNSVQLLPIFRGISQLREGPHPIRIFPPVSSRCFRISLYRPVPPWSCVCTIVCPSEHRAAIASISSRVSAASTIAIPMPVLTLNVVMIPSLSTLNIARFYNKVNRFFIFLLRNDSRCAIFSIVSSIRHGNAGDYEELRFPKILLLAVTKWVGKSEETGALSFSSGGTSGSYRSLQKLHRTHKMQGRHRGKGSLHPRMCRIRIPEVHLLRRIHRC